MTKWPIKATAGIGATYFTRSALSINEGGVPNVHIALHSPRSKDLMFFYLCLTLSRRWVFWLYWPTWVRVWWARRVMRRRFGYDDRPRTP